MPATDAIRVVVRLFTKADSSLASPLAFVIISSRMVDTAIVPDSYIVRILPSKADLKIVILSQQFQKPLSKLDTLIFRNFVDALGVVANGKDTFPSGDLRLC